MRARALFSSCCCESLPGLRPRFRSIVVAKSDQNLRARMPSCSCQALCSAAWTSGLSTAKPEVTARRRRVTLPGSKKPSAVPSSSRTVVGDSSKSWSTAARSCPEREGCSPSSCASPGQTPTMSSLPCVEPPGRRPAVVWTSIRCGAVSSAVLDARSVESYYCRGARCSAGIQPS